MVIIIWEMNKLRAFKTCQRQQNNIRVTFIERYFPDFEQGFALFFLLFDEHNKIFTYF